MNWVPSQSTRISDQLFGNMKIKTKPIDLNSNPAVAKSIGKMFSTMNTGMQVDMVGNAVGNVANLVTGIWGMTIQAGLANRRMRLEEDKMRLAENVAEHSMKMKEKVIDLGAKGMVLKMELAKNLAHTGKDLQVELAKIQADAKVQIASKMATKQLFLQTRNYGRPVAV